jgi:hypothetical protein
LAVILSMAVPPSGLADQHVVAQADIAVRLQAAEGERAANLLKIEGVLAARIPMGFRGAGMRKLSAGLAALSDDELSDLASRADALQADPVAAGPAKALLIVGIVVLALVVLLALIVKSCKEQGAKCLD